MVSCQENVKKKVFENKHQNSHLKTEQTEPFLVDACASRPSGPASALGGCAAFRCSVKDCQGRKLLQESERDALVG